MKCRFRAWLVPAFTLSWLAFAPAPGAWAIAACQATGIGHAVKKPSGQRAAPLLIGDSTSIYAARGTLGPVGINGDARGCRQFRAGLELVRQRRNSGRLPPLVILALGTNGGVPEAQLYQARRSVGPTRVLALVTPKNFASGAAAMRRYVAGHRADTLLIDWAQYSRGRGWFAGDGLHPTPYGARIFAAFVRRRAAAAMPPTPQSLRLPRTANTLRGKDCGAVHRRGKLLQVVVSQRPALVHCNEARRVGRRSPLKRYPRYRAFDWGRTGRGPWSAVYRRSDGAIVVTFSAS